MRTLQREHAGMKCAITAGEAPRARATGGHRNGPPLAELLGELGYDDLWPNVPALERPAIPTGAVLLDVAPGCAPVPQEAT